VITIIREASFQLDHHCFPAPTANNSVPLAARPNCHRKARNMQPSHTNVHLLLVQNFGAPVVDVCVHTD